MPSPSLKISLATSSTCDNITVVDATADYGGGTVTIASVTSNVIVVNLSGGSYLTFTFTIASNVITAATLGLSGATPVSILGSLASTVWPFVATPFSIWRNYGVVIPALSDSVVEIDYTIAGSGFNYTTSSTVLITCVGICCCLSKMSQAIDIECDCSEDAIWNYLRASTYLEVAQMATQIGNTERAQLALDKAIALCNCENCSGC